MNRDDAGFRLAGRTLRHVLAVFFICSLAAGPGVCAAGDSTGPLSTLSIVTAAGAEIDFLVEVADTQASRERGLMFRAELPKDHGMLLWYPEPRVVKIWMKDTYIPLDILFIDASGIIRRVVPGAEPLSEATLSSVEAVQGVLEINAGQADELGIRVGDQVKFSSSFRAAIRPARNPCHANQRLDSGHSPGCAGLGPE